MNNRKVLMLGGSYFQVPAIKYAKAKGYYVITCDYLPENPGHKYSDEYYNISTTDLDAILNLARKLNIDGIVAYASDPAAPTAAFVAEKLGLPGNPYESVKILTEKDLFRDFLKNHDFNVPFAESYVSLDEILSRINKFKFPVMVKPVDSSGSKGIKKVASINDLKSAFNYALSFSRNKRVIVEEFISAQGAQMHGDAFIVDGELIFCYLGDHHYNLDINSLVPYSTTLPSLHSENILLEVEKELKHLVDELGIKQGAFNIEARVDTCNNVYLMEVGPRNGGNLVPQLEQYATGFDMVAASVDIAVGDFSINNNFVKEGNFAYYVIHSCFDGILKDIIISEEIKHKIIEEHIFVNKGDSVIAFNGSNATLGIILLEFSSKDDMQTTISNMNRYIKVDLV